MNYFRIKLLIQSLNEPNKFSIIYMLNVFYVFCVNVQQNDVIHAKTFEICKIPP